MILQGKNIELEQEIFFGYKEYKAMAANEGFSGDELKTVANENYKMAIRKEATQLAAMACRIIQELT